MATPNRFRKDLVKPKKKRMIDLVPLKDLERSMMLRLPVYLLMCDGEVNKNDVYDRDGQFTSSATGKKLDLLVEKGYFTYTTVGERTVVGLTPKGRRLAELAKQILDLTGEEKA
jgi:hypothetical protein